MLRSFSVRMLLSAACVPFLAAPSDADVFTYVNKDGKTVTDEARLVGRDEKVTALEFADGRIALVEIPKIKKRVPKPGPKPLTPQQMLEKLEKRFGKDTLRAAVNGQYMVAVVLAAPLPEQYEEKAQRVLERSADYMQQIHRVFTRFGSNVGVQLTEPKYPQVMLIFETDADFNAYANDGKKTSLSTSGILGFYSPLTNLLAVRMKECQKFETPLHEAIHQQSFNRGLLQRLAPIPKWYGEGLATGFEGDGRKINVGPTKISQLYAGHAVRGTFLPWQVVATSDGAFGADIFAGDAYTHAWSMHWLLVTQHQEGYAKYVKHLASLKPLQRVTPKQRAKAFHDAFQKTPGELQLTFSQTLKTAMRKQNVSIIERGPQVGRGIFEHNLSVVSVVLKNKGAALEVRGTLKNTSPIRPMTFHVIAMTDTGTYADWLVEDLATRRRVRLEPKLARKVAVGGRPGNTKTVYVIVEPAVPGTEKEKKWKQGPLPVPVHSQPRRVADDSAGSP